VENFDITVIIPTFNSGQTIEKSLGSVLSQKSVGINTEIIVVDGASQDDTLDIVREFRAENIKIISEQDAGIYDAINKGISLARGAMIGVLGSDDSYAPHTISCVKKNMKDGIGIISGMTEIDGKIRTDERYGVTALISGIPFGHNAMFASRTAYKKVGLYDLSYRICADAQWVHRAIKLGISHVGIQKIFVFFGSAGTSSMNPDAIMDESYRIIVENFPFLSTEEAKYLLFAYRKWNDNEKISSIAKRYKNEKNFIKILYEAFPSEAHKLIRNHSYGIKSFIEKLKNSAKSSRFRPWNN